MKKPSIINPGGSGCIAAGSGTGGGDVNKLLKQFEMMQHDDMAKFKKSPSGFCSMPLSGMMGNPYLPRLFNNYWYTPVGYSR